MTITVAQGCESWWYAHVDPLGYLGADGAFHDTHGPGSPARFPDAAAARRALARLLGGGRPDAVERGRLAELSRKVADAVGHYGFLTELLADEDRLAAVLGDALELAHHVRRLFPSRDE